MRFGQDSVTMRVSTGKSVPLRVTVRFLQDAVL